MTKPEWNLRLALREGTKGNEWRSQLLHGKGELLHTKGKFGNHRGRPSSLVSSPPLLLTMIVQSHLLSPLIPPVIDYDRKVPKVRYSIWLVSCVFWLVFPACGPPVRFDVLWVVRDLGLVLAACCVSRFIFPWFSFLLISFNDFYSFPCIFSFSSRRIFCCLSLSLFALYMYFICCFYFTDFYFLKILYWYFLFFFYETNFDIFFPSAHCHPLISLPFLCFLFVCLFVCLFFHGFVLYFLFILFSVFLIDTRSLDVSWLFWYFNLHVFFPVCHCCPCGGNGNKAHRDVSSSL